MTWLKGQRGKGTADEWQGHYPKGPKRCSYQDAGRSMFALFQRKRPMPLGAAVTAEIAKGYSIPKITAAPAATPLRSVGRLVLRARRSTRTSASLAKLSSWQTKHRLSRSSPAIHPRRALRRSRLSSESCSTARGIWSQRSEIEPTTWFGWMAHGRRSAACEKSGLRQGPGVPFVTRH
jgi:hypothetical protein